MADLITRLKVDSTEYDAKIKRAAQGLQHYVQSAHDSGDVIGRLLGDTKKYVESLGNMATVSTTARGRLNELTAAFTDLRSVYNSLSEEEKSAKGGFGQELNKQLEILKGRINDTKKELKDIDKELNNTKQASDEAKGGLEGLASALGINIKSLIGWGTALAAGKAALDVAKDAFMSSETNVDEWGRTLSSADGIYQSFLQSLNTSDFSGFLNNIGQVTQAAKEAYDALDELGTRMTIINPERARLQARQQELRADIRRNGANSEVGKAALQELKKIEPLLSKSFKTESQMNYTAFEKLVRERLAEGGINLNQRSFEQFMKTFSSDAAFQNLRRNARGSVTTEMTGNAYNPNAAMTRRTVDTRNTEQKLLDLFTDEWRQANSGYLTASFSAQGSAASNALGNARYMKAGSGGGKGGNGKGDKQEQTELQQNQKRINDLTQEYVKLGDNATEAARKRQEEIQKEIKLLEERNGLLNLRAEQAQGRLLLKDEDINREGIRRTKNNDLGLADGFNPSKPAQLSEKAMKAVQKSIDKQTSLQAKELKDEEKQKTTVAGGLNDLAGGMNSVVGGLEQLGIEIPSGLKDVLGGMQAISSILTGIAATVIAIEAIAGADAIIPFANGGIVPKAAGGMLIPGNYMSGDNLRMPVNGGGIIGVNSGELILSRSQQNNLANALSGGGMSNMRLEAVVSGEQLLLVQNHRGLRTGRGEIVQSKRR